MHFFISPALLSILVLPIHSWFFLTSIFFCTPTSAPLFNYLLFISQVLLKATLALGKLLGLKSPILALAGGWSIHLSVVTATIKTILMAPFNLTTACLTVSPSHWSVSSVPKTVLDWHLINIWYIFVHLNFCQFPLITETTGERGHFNCPSFYKQEKLPHHYLKKSKGATENQILFASFSSLRITIISCFHLWLRLVSLQIKKLQVSLTLKVI